MKNGIHSDRIFKSRRKSLRTEATSQEQKLWKYLRGKNLKFKFQRQHSIGPYIVDFYCARKKLIIELDGNQHIENKEYDQERTYYLETLGYKVIRFWNNQITAHLPSVLMRIEEALSK